MRYFVFLFFLIFSVPVNAQQYNQMSLYDFRVVTQDVGSVFAIFEDIVKYNNSWMETVAKNPSTPPENSPFVLAYTQYETNDYVFDVGLMQADSFCDTKLVSNIAMSLCKLRVKTTSKSSGHIYIQDVDRICFIPGNTLTSFDGVTLIVSTFDGSQKINGCDVSLKVTKPTS